MDRRDVVAHAEIRGVDVPQQLHAQAAVAVDHVLELLERGLLALQARQRDERAEVIDRHLPNGRHGRSCDERAREQPEPELIGQLEVGVVGHRGGQRDRTARVRLRKY